MCKPKSNIRSRVSARKVQKGSFQSRDQIRSGMGACARAARRCVHFPPPSGHPPGGCPAHPHLLEMSPVVNEHPQPPCLPVPRNSRSITPPRPLPGTILGVLMETSTAAHIERARCIRNVLVRSMELANGNLVITAVPACFSPIVYRLYFGEAVSVCNLKT